MEQKNNKFIVYEENDGERIDSYLSSINDTLSRSFIQKLIKDNLVLANGKTVKPSFKVSTDDEISISVPESIVPDILPENIPLSILYEDDDVILVDKPKGMVVHPAAGHYTGTLVNAIMYHCGSSLSGINGVLRPGIVHRIDKDTTGVLICCKNDIAHNSLAEQLKVHSINRRYYALVQGNLKDDEGTIEGPIGRHPQDRKKMCINYQNGKPAVTHYRVLERFTGYTFIECRLETGRTHQIRVHMSSINHPLVGDTIYGAAAKTPWKTEGQCLHAHVLGFIHPRTNEYIEVEAPIPAYFEKILKDLRLK